MKYPVYDSKFSNLFNTIFHAKAPNRLVPIVLACIVIVISGCDSSSEEMTGNTHQENRNEENVIEEPADCDFWGDYADIVRGNYEAQKTAGVSNPMEQTKKWITYDSAEVGSPAKDYFDSILTAIVAGLGVDEVRQLGISVCSKYSAGQMDSANFYDSIE